MPSRADHTPIPAILSHATQGCHTEELAQQICLKLPHLKVICWSSVAEDAAARSFALGFYDAVGAMISSGDTIHVELAFWAGLEHFSGDGFRLGDPSVYLHKPGHPHTLRPVFSAGSDGKPCKGCLPPVHGKVQLLRASESTAGVVVETLRLETGSRADPLRRSVEPGGQGANYNFVWDPVRRGGAVLQAVSVAASEGPPALAPPPLRAATAVTGAADIDAVSCSANAEHVSIEVEGINACSSSCGAASTSDHAACSCS